jgi:hypothetical protein
VITPNRSAAAVLPGWNEAMAAAPTIGDGEGPLWHRAGLASPRPARAVG